MTLDASLLAVSAFWIALTSLIAPRSFGVVKEIPPQPKWEKILADSRGWTQNPLAA